MAEIEYRVSWHWQQSINGYSMTFNRVSSSTSEMGGAIKTMSERLMAMMTPDVSLNAVRVSVQGAPRSGTIMVPPFGFLSVADDAIELPRVGTLASGPLTKPELGRVCVQLAVLVGTARVGTRYLGPIPDAAVTGDPGNLPLAQAPEWFEAFKTWRGYVATGQWGLRIRGASRGPTDKPIKFWAVQAAPPGLWTANVNRADPLIVPADGKVLVSGVKSRRRGQATTNGAWMIRSVVDDVANGVQVIAIDGGPAADIANFKSMGWIRPHTSAFAGIGWLYAVRAGIHKRGTPFGVHRGRLLMRA